MPELTHNIYHRPMALQQGHQHFSLCKSLERLNMEVTHGLSEMSMARQSDEIICPVVLLVDKDSALMTLWTMAECPLLFTRTRSASVPDLWLWISHMTTSW